MGCARVFPFDKSSGGGLGLGIVAEGCLGPPGRSRGLEGDSRDVREYGALSDGIGGNVSDSLRSRFRVGWDIASILGQSPKGGGDDFLGLVDCPCESWSRTAAVGGRVSIVCMCCE